MAKKRKRKRARRKNPGHKKKTRRTRKRRRNPGMSAAPTRKRRRGRRKHRRNPSRRHHGKRRTRRNPESVAKELAIAGVVGVGVAAATAVGTTMLAQRLLGKGAANPTEALTKVRIAQGVTALAGLAAGFLVATKMKKPEIGTAIAAGAVAGPVAPELAARALAFVNKADASVPKAPDQPKTNGIGAVGYRQMGIGAIGTRQPSIGAVDFLDTPPSA